MMQVLLFYNTETCDKLDIMKCHSYDFAVQIISIILHACAKPFDDSCRSTAL